MENHGFAVAQFDPCVMVRNDGSFFISIYVDDLTLFGPAEEMPKVKKILTDEFKTTDMGDLCWLLGVKISFDSENMVLSQHQYIQDVLNRFGMQNLSQKVLTPIVSTLQHTKEGDKLTDIKVYQQIIGSVMYLAVLTRPDCTFAVNHLSQFLSRPNIVHLTAAKHLLRYLASTSNLSLKFPLNQPLQLVGYSDSSYANDPTSRKSYSAYVFTLAGCTVSWKTKLQKVTATSSTESEYIALSMAAKQAVWLQRALKELLGEDIESIVKIDSKSDLDLAKNHMISDKSKHIKVRYHYIRELVEEGELKVVHTPGKENLADIGTKALKKTDLVQLRQLVKLT